MAGWLSQPERGKGSTPTYQGTSLLLSSSTPRRLHYPQRSSWQAVVTGVVPSPWYVPSFLSSIGFSFSTARRFSSNVANSGSRAFRQWISTQGNVPASTDVHWVRTEPTKLIWVGTSIPYRATISTQVPGARCQVPGANTLWRRQNRNYIESVRTALTLNTRTSS